MRAPRPLAERALSLLLAAALIPLPPSSVFADGAAQPPAKEASADAEALAAAVRKATEPFKPLLETAPDKVDWKRFDELLKALDAAWGPAEKIEKKPEALAELAKKRREIQDFSAKRPRGQPGAGSNDEPDKGQPRRVNASAIPSLVAGGVLADPKASAADQAAGSRALFDHGRSLADMGELIGVAGPAPRAKSVAAFTDYTKNPPPQVGFKPAADVPAPQASSFTPARAAAAPAQPGVPDALAAAAKQAVKDTDPTRLAAQAFSALADRASKLMTARRKGEGSVADFQRQREQLIEQFKKQVEDKQAKADDKSLAAERSRAQTMLMLLRAMDAPAAQPGQEPQDPKQRAAQERQQRLAQALAGANVLDGDRAGLDGRLAAFFDNAANRKLVEGTPLAQAARFWADGALRDPGAAQDLSVPAWLFGNDKLAKIERRVRYRRGDGQLADLSSDRPATAIPNSDEKAAPPGDAEARDGILWVGADGIRHFSALDGKYDEVIAPATTSDRKKDLYIDAKGETIAVAPGQPAPANARRLQFAQIQRGDSRQFLTFYRADAGDRVLAGGPNAKGERGFETAKTARDVLLSWSQTEGERTTQVDYQNGTMTRREKDKLWSYGLSSDWKGRSEDQRWTYATVDEKGQQHVRYTRWLQRASNDEDAPWLQMQRTNHEGPAGANASFTVTRQIASYNPDVEVQPSSVAEIPATITTLAGPPKKLQQDLASEYRQERDGNGAAPDVGQVRSVDVALNVGGNAAAPSSSQLSALVQAARRDLGESERFNESGLAAFNRAFDNLRAHQGDLKGGIVSVSFTPAVESEEKLGHYDSVWTPGAEVPGMVWVQDGIRKHRAGGTAQIDIVGTDAKGTAKRLTEVLEQVDLKSVPEKAPDIPRCKDNEQCRFEKLRAANTAYEVAIRDALAQRHPDQQFVWVPMRQATRMGADGNVKTVNVATGYLGGSPDHPTFVGLQTGSTHVDEDTIRQRELASANKAYEASVARQEAAKKQGFLSSMLSLIGENQEQAQQLERMGNAQLYAPAAEYRRSITVAAEPGGQAFTREYRVGETTSLWNAAEHGGEYVDNSIRLSDFGDRNPMTAAIAGGIAGGAIQGLGDPTNLAITAGTMGMGAVGVAMARSASAAVRISGKLVTMSKHGVDAYYQTTLAIGLASDLKQMTVGLATGDAEMVNAAAMGFSSTGVNLGVFALAPRAFSAAARPKADAPIVAPRVDAVAVAPRVEASALEPATLVPEKAPDPIAGARRRASETDGERRAEPRPDQVPATPSVTDGAFRAEDALRTAVKQERPVEERRELARQSVDAMADALRFWGVDYTVGFIKRGGGSDPIITINDVPKDTRLGRILASRGRRTLEDRLAANDDLSILQQPGAPRRGISVLYDPMASVGSESGSYAGDLARSLRYTAGPILASMGPGRPNTAVPHEFKHIKTDVDVLNRRENPFAPTFRPKAGTYDGPYARFFGLDETLTQRRDSRSLRRDDPAYALEKAAEVEQIASQAQRQIDGALTGMRSGTLDVLVEPTTLGYAKAKISDPALGEITVPLAPKRGPQGVAPVETARYERLLPKTRIGERTHVETGKPIEDPAALDYARRRTVEQLEASRRAAEAERFRSLVDQAELTADVAKRGPLDDVQLKKARDLADRLEKELSRYEDLERSGKLTAQDKVQVDRARRELERLRRLLGGSRGPGGGSPVATPGGGSGSPVADARPGGAGAAPSPSAGGPGGASGGPAPGGSSGGGLGSIGSRLANAAAPMMRALGLGDKAADKGPQAAVPRGEPPPARTEEPARQAAMRLGAPPDAAASPAVARALPPEPPAPAAPQGARAPAPRVERAPAAEPASRVAERGPPPDNGAPGFAPVGRGGDAGSEGFAPSASLGRVQTALSEARTPERASRSEERAPREQPSVERPAEPARGEAAAERPQPRETAVAAPRAEQPAASAPAEQLDGSAWTGVDPRAARRAAASPSVKRARGPLDRVEEALASVGDGLSGLGAWINEPSRLPLVGRLWAWTPVGMLGHLLEGAGHALGGHTPDMFLPGGSQDPLARRLEGKARELASMEDFPGGAGGVLTAKKRLRALLTKDIAAADLPYESALRPRPNLKPELPSSLDEVRRAAVTRVTDIGLASEEHSGSAGLVRLAYLEDGRPVALKTFYLRERNGKSRDTELPQIMLEEARAAQLYSELGVGPEFHGLWKDADGRWNVVFDVARGDFSGTPVNDKTFSDLETILARMRAAGMGQAGDLQLYRSPEGRLLVIDPNGAAEGLGRAPLRDPDSKYGYATAERLAQLREAPDDVARGYLTALSAENPAAFRALAQRLRDSGKATDWARGRYDDVLERRPAGSFDLRGGDGAPVSRPAGAPNLAKLSWLAFEEAGRALPERVADVKGVAPERLESVEELGCQNGNSCGLHALAAASGKPVEALRAAAAHDVSELGLSAEQLVALAAREGVSLRRLAPREESAVGPMTREDLRRGLSSPPDDPAARAVAVRGRETADAVVAAVRDGRPAIALIAMENGGALKAHWVTALATAKDSAGRDVVLVYDSDQGVGRVVALPRERFLPLMALAEEARPAAALDLVADPASKAVGSGRGASAPALFGGAAGFFDRALSFLRPNALLSRAPAERPVAFDVPPTKAQAEELYRHIARVDVPDALVRRHAADDVAEYSKALNGTFRGRQLELILPRQADLRAVFGAAKEAGLGPRDVGLALDLHGPYRVARFLVEHAGEPALRESFQAEFAGVRNREKLVLDDRRIRAQPEVSLYRGTQLSDRTVGQLFKMDWNEYLDSPLRFATPDEHQAFTKGFTLFRGRHFTVDPAIAGHFAIDYSPSDSYRALVEFKVPGGEVSVPSDSRSNYFGEAELAARSLGPDKLARIAFLFNDGRVVDVPGDLLRARDYQAIGKLFADQKIPRRQWPSILRDPASADVPEPSRVPANGGDSKVYQTARMADAEREEALARLGLNPRQVSAVMEAHGRNRPDLACPVYKCTDAQLREKLRLMEKAGIQRDLAKQLIREGFAGSAYEAGGARVELTPEHLRQINEAARNISSQYPPDRYVMVGLGRSPTPIVAALQNGMPDYAYNLPLTGFREPFRSLEPARREALLRQIGRYLPSAEAVGDRTIVVVDYAGTGASLFAGSAAVSRYLESVGRPRRVRSLALTPDAAIDRKIHSYAGDTTIPVDLLPPGKQVAPRVLKAMGDGEYERYSEYGAFSVSGEADSAAEVPARRRAEYAALGSALARAPAKLAGESEALARVDANFRERPPVQLTETLTLSREPGAAGRLVVLPQLRYRYDATRDSLVVESAPRDAAQRAFLVSLAREQHPGAAIEGVETALDDVAAAKELEKRYGRAPEAEMSGSVAAEARGGGGRLEYRYSAADKRLSVTDLQVVQKGKGLSEYLLLQALRRHSDTERIAGTLELDNKTALAEGGLENTAAYKARARFGFTAVEQWDPASRRLVMAKPRSLDKAEVERVAAFPDADRRRALARTGLSDAQIEAVMTAHNRADLRCEVYRCTSRQLREKLRLMERAGLDVATSKRLVREGYAGDPPQEGPSVDEVVSLVRNGAIYVDNNVLRAATNDDPQWQRFFKKVPKARVVPQVRDEYEVKLDDIERGLAKQHPERPRKQVRSEAQRQFHQWRLKERAFRRLNDARLGFVSAPKERSTALAGFLEANLSREDAAVVAQTMMSCEQPRCYFLTADARMARGLDALRGHPEKLRQFIARQREADGAFPDVSIPEVVVVKTSR